MSVIQRRIIIRKPKPEAEAKIEIEQGIKNENEDGNEEPRNENENIVPPIEIKKERVVVKIKNPTHHHEKDKHRHTDKNRDLKKIKKKETKKIQEIEVERLIDPDEHSEFVQCPEFSTMNIDSLESELDKCTDELENLRGSMNSTDAKQIDKVIDKRIKLLETKITQMNSQKKKILSLTKKVDDNEFYSEIDLTTKFKTSEPDPSLVCFIKGKSEKIEDYKPIPATLQKQKVKLFANKPLPKNFGTKSNLIQNPI